MLRDVENDRDIDRDIKIFLGGKTPGHLPGHFYGKWLENCIFFIRISVTLGVTFYNFTENEMAYESKKALLLSMGKNPDDRNLVKRMIERGEVYEEGGMYYLVSEEGVVKEEKKSESKVKVEIDDSELRKLKVMNEKLMNAYKKLSKEKEVYMGMYDHLVFFYGKFKEWKRFVDGKVFGQTQYDLSRGIQQKEELVRDGMYEKYKFEFGDVEQAECDAVDKIIAQRNEELAEIPF